MPQSSARCRASSRSHLSASAEARQGREANEGREAMNSGEQIRLEEAGWSKLPVSPWRKWGPYVAERAWGTVREDYSGDGRAWEHFPFEHSHLRAYRWTEDGLAGICDNHQRLCFALALWNGRDPILKERLFGVSGNQGNHG